MAIRYPRRVAAALAIAGIGLLAAACGSSPAPAKPAAAPTAQPAQPTAAPAATAAAQPAAAAATNNKLFIASDIVQGTKNLAQDQMSAKSCVGSSRYPRNAEILWRARVIDPSTGKEMDDKALKSVVLKMADGKVVEAKYGKHSDESFWVAGWVVPKDYPTGTVNFTLVATAADGRTGEFKPFQVAPSLLTVTNEVLPDVAPPPAPEKKS